MANKKDLALLSVIIAAMANTESPFHMASEKEYKVLLAEGLVEVNTEIKDGDKVAVRATADGFTASQNAASSATPQPNTAAPTESKPIMSQFAIIEGAVLPAKRGGRGSNLYPFADLKVGGSFFVPTTEAKPNPAKSLASTVSGLNKKNKDNAKDGETVARFEVAPVKSGVAYGAFTAPADGALVARVA